jgi:hypothetical protein
MRSSIGSWIRGKQRGGRNTQMHGLEFISFESARFINHSAISAAQREGEEKMVISDSFQI